MDFSPLSYAMLWLLGIVATAQHVMGWPNPPSISGNVSWIHDPIVIRRASDSTYFRISTNGNIAIATAPALTGPWTYQGAMLSEGSITTVTDDQVLWAPDCHLVSEVYYCFYSISKTGFQGSRIGVAYSSTMDVGTWTDLGAIDIPASDDYNMIDPSLFQQASGEPFYFTFGSSWQDIYQTILDPSTNFTTQASGASPQHIEYNSTISPGIDRPPVVEGAFQWWWSDPTTGDPVYWLFFSSGACCNMADGTGSLAPAGEEYKIMVCRSDTPTGPFVDQSGRDCLTENGGTMILGSHDNVYAPGGQSVMFDQGTQRIAMVYHFVDPTVGYLREQFQFGFNYLDFSSGWPVVVD